MVSNTEPLVIGLTGSIGSGKTEAGRMFGALGASIIDADIIARDVVQPGTRGLQAIVSEFGSRYLLSDGTLNRKLLGTAVFQDPTKREKLEAILHPEIRAEFKRRLAEAKKSGARLIVYVVPLLFEVKYDFPELSKKIAVLANRELCLDRIAKRDSLSPEEAARRFAAQIPPEKKAELADLVIMNNGSLEELREKVLSVYRDLVVS